MNTVTPWITDWDNDSPIQLTGARVDYGQGSWAEGPVPYLSYRSLDLDRASGNKMAAWHVRKAGTVGNWQADDVDFQFYFLLKGSMTVEFASGKIVNLLAESSITIPALYRYRVTSISDDFEALQVVAPKAYAVIWGEGAELPARVATLDPGRSPIWNHEQPEEYSSGGLRAFFEYRDLGTQAVTDDRVRIQIVDGRGTPHEEGTGWHYHSWAQWVMVIGGHADLRVEKLERQRLGYGDSSCLGAGPTQRHFVDRVSGDYKAIEMAVPGWTDSIPTDAPEGSAE